ncbi:MAG: M48 family metallopeptidase, partial [Acidobacteriota bacterium]
MSTIDLHQMHPRAFAHPLDRKAMDALASVPVLPTLIKKVRHLQFEKKFRAMQTHRSVELGSHQLRSLWLMVQKTAERLGMNPPRAYVTSQGGINAFAFGVQEFSILLTSELVDLMNDRELEAIIAHELAHVLCEHMLYRQVGLALCSEAFAPLTAIAPAAVVKAGISHALLSWYRSSEYTADRAALLALGDPEVIASCMARLAGVPRRYHHEFDASQFL